MSKSAQFNQSRTNVQISDISSNQHRHPRHDDKPTGDYSIHGVRNPICMTRYQCSEHC